jgi:hypothetical protein
MTEAHDDEDAPLVYERIDPDAVDEFQRFWALPFHGEPDFEFRVEDD